LFLMVV
jgi:hypothetical protein